MKTRLLAWWDALHSSYWFVPVLMMLAAAATAAVAVSVDVHAGAITRHLDLFAASAAGARDMLTTVASAMMTVAGLTFSITIVALTVAAQQYGPRLLRNFMRDRVNQFVLGAFVAVFLYCLLVLGTIRADAQGGFVPYFAVTLGVVLGMLGLVVLAYFIHHISTSIHASQVVHMVAVEIDEGIERLFPEELGAAAPMPPPPLPEGTGDPVLAAATGYLQLVDGDGLVDAARAHDVVVRLAYRPGDYVVAGTPVATVWPRGTDALARRINDALILGAQRTPLQDVAFSIDQLVEVAVRALSPGVNDPFTAMTCIDRLVSALCRLARRRFPSPFRVDADGALRVVVEPPTFAALVDTAVDQIREYGRDSTAVTVHLIDALAVVADFVPGADEARAVLRQGAMLERGAAALGEAGDRDAVRDRGAALRARLAARGFTLP